MEIERLTSMDPSTAKLAPALSLSEAVAEERRAAVEQLAAAWQLHIARIEDVLAAGWREHIERVFEERFAELSVRLEDRLESELATRLAAERESVAVQARETARRQSAEALNVAVRRFAPCEKREDWAGALLDSTAGYSSRAAVISVRGQTFEGVRSRGLNDEKTPSLTFAAADAPAFANAVSSRDTVVSLRSARELSAGFAALLETSDAQKAFLFPIAAQDRVLAVLYADGGDSDDVEVAALETMAGLAGLALGSRVSWRIADTRPAPGVGSSEWAQLSENDQELHLKAQRFARVQVAEMRLYKSPAVKSGRAAKDLYRALKAEIDAARETFNSQFVSATPTMVDYLHLELVRTLANDDPALLGPVYPGPLV